MKGVIRPEVQEFTAYSPGLSIDEIREKYGLETVVKLASNENPLGTSPLVRKAIERHSGLAFRYPQAGNPRLVAALAEHHGVKPGNIVVGNGSDEIIDLLIRARVRPGKENVLAFDPCFSMYKLQAKLCGVEFRQVPLLPDLCFDWEGLLAAVDEATGIVFVTTPDNPSGYAPDAAELEAIARALPEGCLFVVDEAYMDFALPQENYSLLPRREEFSNLVVLRTFSKRFGLAGLRLGYGVMPEWLADYLWRIRMPFSVNILAEEAGIAALADTVFYRETLEVTLAGREYYGRELERLGCLVYPSHSNFILFKLPENAGMNAKTVFQKMLEKGVIIRPLPSYGLPEHLRVSIGSERENKVCIQVLEEVLGG